MAKFSVIVPAFNCELYIEQCVRSLLSQSETDVEILAVDDGSTDGTLQILRQLVAEDCRVSIQSYHPNSGYPGFARNRGIERATGEYIAFLDGDDLYHPQKFRTVLSVFQALPEVTVVFHDVMRFDSTPDATSAISFLRTQGFTQIASDYLRNTGEGVYLCDKDLYKFASLRFVPCHTSAIVIRRQALLAESVIFPEGRHGEDGDLWFRLLKKHRFAFVEEVLSYYRQRPGSITSDQMKYLGGAVRIHRDNLARGRDVFSRREKQLYKRKIAQFLYDFGYAQSCSLAVNQGRQAYVESMATYFLPRALLAYLKTFVPQSAARRLRQISDAVGQ